jgi:REP element-mobilizing transposase RayT
MPLAHLDPLSKHPLVFLTACTAKRMSVLDNAEAHSILNSIWHDSFARNGWYVGRYVIMPDHVHLFAMPAGKAIPLHQWVALWKSISSSQNRGQRTNLATRLFRSVYTHSGILQGEVGLCVQ